MKHLRSLLVGPALAALVVIGLPGGAGAAAGDNPYFTVHGYSYSGQPRTFSVGIVNNLENSRLTARISGTGLSSSLSCRRSGALASGLGQWTCTLAGSYRLNPGSYTVTAQASGAGGKSKAISHGASVSSRFGITSHSSPREGDSFTVKGRYDHISGRSDYRVKATVTGSGGVVAGQSGTSCSASGGSYTCTLRSEAGRGSSYTVTVTEVGASSRSRTTTVPVTVTAAPPAPAFSGSSKYAVTKQPGAVTGTARSGSVVQVVVDPAGTPDFSSPTASCTASSSGSWSCPLPKLAQGKHQIAARAIDPTDATKISAVSFRTTTVTAKPVTAPRPPTATPTPVTAPDPQVETPPVAAPVKTGIRAFDGLSHPFSELLLLLVIGLAITALARPGPLSLAFGGNSATFATDEDAAAGYELALQRGIGIGDNSPTWRAFGHEATDYWSRTMPGLLHRFSPFLSRLASDGVDLRAMFGTLWWLVPIGGGALGVAAASNTGGHAEVPALGILITTMVLACFDALAGFVTSVLFMLFTVGDVVKDKHSALTVLAIGFLWTALPLIATAIRPLRRPGALSWKYGWDRVADLVITALLCGWVAQKIAQTMDLFAGTPTGVPAHANQIGLIAVVAIAFRVLLANAVDVWWPERLRQTEIQEDLPEPNTSAILAGVVVRTAVFAFLGHAFIGSCWQWWAGVALFALPDLLLVVRDWFGIGWRLQLPLPRGVTEIFVIVVGCIVLIALLVANAGSEQTALRYGFLAAGVIPAMLGSASVFGNPRRDRNGSTWDLQLAGAGIVVTLTVLGLHGWNF